MQHPLFLLLVGWLLGLLTPQITERSDLKLQPYFSVANYLKDGNLCFVSYINATNGGKKPIGLRSAKLEVVLNERKTVKLDTVPSFRDSISQRKPEHQPLISHSSMMPNSMKMQ